jgi:hypothetical protein
MGEVHSTGNQPRPSPASLVRPHTSKRWPGRLVCAQTLDPPRGGAERGRPEPEPELTSKLVELAVEVPAAYSEGPRRRHGALS